MSRPDFREFSEGKGKNAKVLKGFAHLRAGRIGDGGGGGGGGF